MGRGCKIKWMGLAEEALLKEGLHVAATVGDEHDVHIVAADMVNDAVRLEEYLSELVNTKSEELFGAATSIRRFFEPSALAIDTPDDSFGFRFAIVGSDVIVDIANVLCRAVRQMHGVAH